MAAIIYGCNYKLGISERLNEKEIADLLKFIYENFPDFNATELEHAITLYCTRELPDIDFTTEKHYNKFSYVFLGMILKSYRKYRSNRQLMESKAKKKPLIEQDKTHDSLIWYTKNIFLPYEDLKNGKNRFNDLDLRQFFKEMNPKGLFKDYLESKGYLEFLEQAKELTPRKYRTFENRKPESDEEYETRCKKVASRLLVMDWLQNKVMEDVDIREIIIPLIKKV